jgi:hypothetical protein
LNLLLSGIAFFLMLRLELGDSKIRKILQILETKILQEAWGHTVKGRPSRYFKLAGRFDELSFYQSGDDSG